MNNKKSRLIFGLILITVLIIVIVVLVSTRSQRVIASTTHLFEAGKFEEAIENCDKIEMNFPDLADQAELLRQNIYVDWGKKNLAEKEYAPAKDHLIAAMNGTASMYGQDARMTLFDLTTGWVQSLIDEQKYEEAVKVVDDLSGSEVREQSERSAEFLNCKDPEIYIMWGDSLVSEKNFIDALGAYNKGLQLDQDCPVLFNQLATKRKEAYIAYAEALNSDGKFEDSISLLQKSDFADNLTVRDVIAKSLNGQVRSQMEEKKYREVRDYLTNIKDVDSDMYEKLEYSVEKVNSFLLDDLINGNDLMDAYKTVNDLLSGSFDKDEKSSLTAKKTQILEKLASDTGEDGKNVMRILTDIACSGKPAKQNELSSLIAAKGEKRKAYMCNFAFSLDSQFNASKPAELKYAVWGWETKRNMASCKYEDGYSLQPVIVSWEIKIYDVLSGNVISRNTLSGKYPTCPQMYRFHTGTYNETLTGDPPTIDQVNKYLKSVIR